MAAKLDTVVEKLAELPRQMGDTVGSDVVQRLSTALDSFAQKITMAPQFQFPRPVSYKLFMSVVYLLGMAVVALYIRLT